MKNNSIGKNVDYITKHESLSIRVESMNLLASAALYVAKKAHEGQVDKAGNPYYKHLESVAIRVYNETLDTDLMCAAILHDILEDTSMTLEQLNDELYKEAHYCYEDRINRVCEVVDVLTRKKGESYNNYILRVSEDDDAKLIKICDLEDNCDLSRFKDATDKVDSVIKLIKERYLPALDFLLDFSLEVCNF